MSKNIVKFKEEGHIYECNKVEYTSVNKFLTNFGFHFDSNYWLVYKALQATIPEFSKLYFKKGFDYDSRKPENELHLIERFQKEIDENDIVLEEQVVFIQDGWDKSNEDGTLFHKEQEETAYKNGFLINPFNKKRYDVQPKPKLTKGWDNKSFADLSDLQDGVHVELLLHSHPHLLAGTGDEVFIETIKNIRYVDIGDHKTNGKEPKYENKNGFCLDPINHLFDCTYTKYWCQVSLYGHLLERFGFKIRNVGFYHYKNYDPDTKKVIKLKYLGEECKNMLDIYGHQI